MKRIEWGKLIISVVGVEAIGFLSSMLSGDIGAKYNAYTTPPLSPPNWVFGVVWPILYALMGIAAYLIWRDAKTTDERRGALIPYVAQVAINFIWSIVFFGWSMLWPGAVLCVLLLATVIYTMTRFARINRTALYLLIPYAVWLTFASYLSIGVAILN